MSQLTEVIVVGIVGASGSGKSCLAGRLVQHFRSPHPPITVDNFYRVTEPTAFGRTNAPWFEEVEEGQEASGASRKTPEAAKLCADLWESPKGIDNEAFVAHLDHLIADAAQKPPTYFHNTFDEAPSTSSTPISTAPAAGRGVTVLVTEGHVLFTFPEVVARCHVRLFLPICMRTCAVRRFLRESWRNIAWTPITAHAATTSPFAPAAAVAGPATPPDAAAAAAPAAAPNAATGATSPSPIDAAVAEFRRAAVVVAEMIAAGTPVPWVRAPGEDNLGALVREVVAEYRDDFFVSVDVSRVPEGPWPVHAPIQTPDGTNATLPDTEHEEEPATQRHGTSSHAVIFRPEVARDAQSVESTPIFVLGASPTFPSPTAPSTDAVATSPAPAATPTPPPAADLGKWTAQAAVDSRTFERFVEWYEAVVWRYGYLVYWPIQVGHARSIKAPLVHKHGSPTHLASLPTGASTGLSMPCESPVDLMVAMHHAKAAVEALF